MLLSNRSKIREVYIVDNFGISRIWRLIKLRIQFFLFLLLFARIQEDFTAGNCNDFDSAAYNAKKTSFLWFYKLERRIAMSTENYFGKTINLLRIANKLSLRDLEKKTDVSYVYLSELENGKKNNPSKEIVEKLANAFNISSNTLDYFAGKMKSDGYDYQNRLLEILEVITGKRSPD